MSGLACGIETFRSTVRFPTRMKTLPSLDVEAWLERNPYQDRELIDRGKADLATVDRVDTG